MLHPVADEALQVSVVPDNGNLDPQLPIRREEKGRDRIVEPQDTSGVDDVAIDGVECVHGACLAGTPAVRSESQAHASVSGAEGRITALPLTRRTC